MPLTPPALIQNDNNRFTNAAIFCGFTFLVASLLSVGPRMVQVIMAHMPGRRRASASEA
jgi:hypothetical protein